MKIWTNVELSESALVELRSRVGKHELIAANEAGSSNLVAGGPDPACRAADIAFGQPSPDDVLGSSSLQWVHLTSAGYTRYDNDQIRESLKMRGARLTNSSGVFDDPCAQHLLAFMLTQSRRVTDSVCNQQTRSWGYSETRTKVRVLRGDNVLIVGFGAIGQRLVELLAPFHLHVRGLRRTVSGKESVPTFTVSEAASHLPWADHIVNILPASQSTERFFDDRVFNMCKPGALFYNIGRGDTVDQDALIRALESEHLAAAYLDVTTPEPLPPDNPLWRVPNCHISPHIGGGMQEELPALVDHFIENLARFDGGAELQNRIF